MAISTPSQNKSVTQNTFYPAYWAAGTSTSTTPPALDTSSANPNQTPSDPTGLTISIPNGPSANNYIWLYTTKPVTSVNFVTQFGPTPAIPDVSTTITPAGQTQVFNVFGFTGLNPNGTTQFELTA
jgi:hypothetical protein